MTTQAKRRGASPDRTGQGPRVGHLDSLTGVLKEMSAVYREMRYGQTPVSDGARLIFSLRCLRDVLEVLAVEKLEQDKAAKQTVIIRRFGPVSADTPVGSHANARISAAWRALAREQKQAQPLGFWAAPSENSLMRRS
jgi:hypothetical protein